MLDAPCSATGILRSKPEVKHHQDEASVAGLVEVQARMLPALWSLLRPGGALLYMTCSLLRAENESVVASFVDAHADDGGQLPPRSEPAADGRAGLVSWQAAKGSRVGRMLGLPEFELPSVLSSY